MLIRLKKLIPWTIVKTLFAKQTMLHFIVTIRIIKQLKHNA